MRLPVLLVLLTGVAIYGVPKIIHGGAGTSAGAAPACPTAPATVMLPDSRFRLMLQASGIDTLVGRGTLDTQGWQEPSSTWADAPPSNHSVADSTPVDAGYEIRWWSISQDHDGATFFVFPSATAAHRYIRQAASVRCRANARAEALSEPSGARGVVWTNPDQARQADVFLARGQAVYRILVVPYESRNDRSMLRLAQRLACKLSAANCPR